MPQIDKYKIILEKIFKREINFSNNSIENNCIEALAHSKNYPTFYDNFTARLRRLRSYFGDSEETINELVKTAKLIAQNKGYKWAGAYSELVALDYWTQLDNIRNIKYPEKDNTDIFQNSIAKRIGQQEVDLDISFELLNKKIYTDVKSLIPTHLELKDIILNQVNNKSKLNKNDYLIEIDNLSEVDYLRTKTDYLCELKEGSLIKNLTESIDNMKTYYKHKLKSGTDVYFRIAYKKNKSNNTTILMTERTINPYSLAKDYEYKILDYYNKLLLNQASLITFVINPWFNQEIYSLSDINQHSDFFRALSRRFFCNLIKNNNKMHQLYPDFIDKELSISDIAYHLTGVVFILDHSIKEADHKQYETYIYLNPNAKNKSLKMGDFMDLDFKSSILIDDFDFDNY